jgi:hypothetical protein
MNKRLEGKVAIVTGADQTPDDTIGNGRATSQGYGINKEQLIKDRNSKIPLKRGIGSGWDTAYATLFFASGRRAPNADRHPGPMAIIGSIRRGRKSHPTVRGRGDAEYQSKRRDIRGGPGDFE